MPANNVLHSVVTVANDAGGPQDDKPLPFEFSEVLRIVNKWFVRHDTYIGC